MKKNKTYIAFTAALLALSLAIAGCGGGGGGTAAGSSSTSVPSYVSYSTGINFGNSQAMRVAPTTIPTTVDTTETEIMYQGCGDFGIWNTAAEATASTDSIVPVYVYVTADAQSLFNTTYQYMSSTELYGPLASACTEIYRDSSTARLALRESGEFVIDNVYAGTNHLLEARAYVGQNGGYPEMIYVAAVVPFVDDGMYTYDVVASPESTLAAAAAIEYANNNSITLTDVEYDDIIAINNAVATLFPSGFSYGTAVTPTGLSSVTFSSYYDFAMTYATGTTKWTDYVIEQAALTTGTTTTAPTVLNITPADGATNVDFDATVFRVTFDMPMDTTVTPSGFALTIQNNSTGGTITINDANAASYGTFAWENVTTQDDGLSFTLNATSVLGTTGLKYLMPGTTYTITTFTVPTNLVSADGVALDTSSITSTTGSFTTAASTATTTGAPTIVSFSPANGATGVSSTSTAFSVVFDMAMDPTITSPAGFSISIQNTGTGGTLVINDLNYSSYGAFTWSSTSTTNDTLVFTLFNSSILAGNGVTGLAANTTYNITSWVAPSNVVSAGAMPVSVTGIPTTGSFTTAP